MGWSKDRVGRIVARYVEQDAVITRMAERIRLNETGTETPEQGPNDRNRSTFGSLSD